MGFGLRGWWRKRRVALRRTPSFFLRNTGRFTDQVGLLMRFRSLRPLRTIFTICCANRCGAEVASAESGVRSTSVLTSNTLPLHDAIAQRVFRECGRRNRVAGERGGVSIVT